ncbi:E3 ubiquitin-protein ligase EL5-like [Miscanthus floridulus]|uniref:E3 ubiquitin-protein ligase EL5-like n=1 Tax=Miscanthus floridulus TaxID=154761 RepID=UPI0034582B2B
MATTTNNAAGGSKNHLSSSQHGSAYGQAYYSQNSGEPSDANDNVMPIVFVAITGVVVLLRILWCGLQKDDAEEQVAGGGDRVGPPSSQAAGLADRDPSMMAAVEVPPVQAAEPPLVCTYRKEDGCEEDSCGVCLAELADGEAIRVLPACMHLFHAACVNEWLRGHDTCPLCRAPLVAPGPGDDI